MKEILLQNFLKLLNYKTNIKQALHIAPVLFLTTTLLCVFSGSCKRIEESSYFNEVREEISRYELNNYKGIVEFPLASDSSYSISASSVSVLNLRSSGKNQEVNAIKALYLGNLATVFSDTIFLVCHGFNHHNDYYYNKAKMLFHSGNSVRKGVLMIDYQGFGLSEGNQYLPKISEDIKAGVKWLEQKGVKPSKFIMYGHGLGAIPACEFSVLNAADSLLIPQRLILENPAGHSDLLASSAIQLNIPSSYLGSYTFDNFEKIARFTGDLLVLISEKDEKFNPVINAQKLYDFHNGSTKNIITIKDATHQNLIPLFPYETFVSEVENLIRTGIQ